MRSMLRLAVFVVFTLGMAATRADESGAEIDLTSFGEAAQQPSSVWDGIPLKEAGRRFEAAPRRLYISGMIGPSFANVTSPNDSTYASSDTLFNAGGALGIAFEREHGRLRLEVEGMGRSTYDAPFASPLRPFACSQRVDVLTAALRTIPKLATVNSEGGGLSADDVQSFVFCSKSHSLTYFLQYRQLRFSFD